jgi:outer membrane protein TolC
VGKIFGRVGPIVMVVIVGSCATAVAQQERPDGRDSVPSFRPLEDGAAVSGETSVPASIPSTLSPDFVPIDLDTALRLAGVQNPELNVARSRVVEAEALRMLAAAQALPNLNLGTNYDNHTGNLQQSNGNILSLNRYALYVGAGSNAVAAGTVNIPGLQWQANVGSAVFAYLAARQVVRQREAAAAARQNDTFLLVCVAYNELLRAEGRLAIARQAREEAREVARLTAAYAASGEGRLADADRAATELARRQYDVADAEGRLGVTSARLCQVINVDPSIRLHPADGFVVPRPIVPGAIPLKELVAIGLLRRPELAERRAAIVQSFYDLAGARLLPFSPNVLFGYSGGAFGGGSNLVRPIFGGFAGRTDLDVVTYWTIQNLGVGNLALNRAANARLQVARYQEIGVLNRVRQEVAEAHARSHARFAQVGVSEEGVRSGRLAFERDFDRIRARAERDVLPIELLDSYRLLNRARYDYLDAITEFNRAQYELYTAMGLPPADALARPAPPSVELPTTQPLPISDPNDAPPRPAIETSR